MTDQPVTTTIIDPGGGVTVWTNINIFGFRTRIETTIEVLEVTLDGGVVMAITPPPAEINIDEQTREGPLTDPSARD